METVRCCPTIPSMPPCRPPISTRLRGFYEDVLGFVPREANPAGIFYDAGGGTYFVVTRSSGKASGSHTQMGFRVADIEAEVARSPTSWRDVRGVRDAQDRRGHRHAPDRPAAWFRDPDGNLIGDDPVHRLIRSSLVLAEAAAARHPIRVMFDRDGRAYSRRPAAEPRPPGRGGSCRPSSPAGSGARSAPISGVAEERFGALESTGVQESDEIYLLGGSTGNAKIRDDLMDIKLLRETQPDLERWEPVLKTAFPYPRDDARRPSRPSRCRHPHSTATVTPPMSSSRTSPSEPGHSGRVDVHKRRVRYTVNGCTSEVTDLVANGQPAARSPSN